MDIQSAVLNQLFVLFPVIIQGWITPVRPAGIAHGGIPQVLYDGQLQGLLCLIDPWTELQRQSWTMAVDDRVDLYINDDPTPVAGVTIKPGEEALRQRLYIPHGYLRQGVNRLHYKVIRVGGNTSEDSRDLLVLYHLRTPDNLDLVIPPDVIKNGVSAERAALGVEFGLFYNNRRPYDRIRLLIGDTQVDFDVPDGNAPITYKLFTDTFLAAGNNPSAVIEYIVTDQLGNPTKSPEKRLDIHLEAETFDSPILRERLDDPGDDQTKIDLKKLAGDPLLVIVPTGDSRFQVGDLISVTYICKVTGQPDVVVTPPAGTVEADEFGQRKPCVVEVPNEHVITDGAVTVAYKVHRANGEVVGSSRVARAQVIGEALPAATLVFTNGPYEVLAGKTFDVGLLLTRAGVPQGDVVVTLRLASGFQFPGGGVGGERDFITDAKGVVTVTGIIASGTEGGHELVAKSKGANDAVALVEVLAEGPVGLIDVGAPQLNIAMSNNGMHAYIETATTIEEINVQNNRVTGSISKGNNVPFYAMLITPDDRTLYGSAFDRGIYVIDIKSRKIIKTIKIRAHYLALSSDGKYLANLHQNETFISLIETTTNNIIRTYPVDIFSYSLLLNHDGTRLYYMAQPSNPEHASTYRSINTQTGALVNTYAFPDKTFSNTYALIFEGNRIYSLLIERRPPVTGGTVYASVAEISADNLTQLRRININYTPANTTDLKPVVVSPNHLLITDTSKTTTLVINLQSGKEDGYIETGIYYATKMAYTIDHTRLYVCNPGYRFLSVIATPKQ